MTESTRERILRIDIQDGLALPNGHVHAAPYCLVIYWRVPESWLDGVSVPPQRLEPLLAQLYGRTWRAGNEDGSRYVILDCSTHALNRAEASLRPWLITSASSGVRVSCYESAIDSIAKVSVAEFATAG